MALFRALESARPPQVRLFEDSRASAFLKPRLRTVAWAAKYPPVGELVCAFIDRRWPGPHLSGVLRTQAIDDFVISSIRDGCEQLLLLGAGYDSRASRLPAAASVSVFEVDHPATQARKRQALGATPANVRYVPVDFESDSLRGELERAGFDEDARTCVLWEGVFSYLTPQAIDETLSALLELCAAASRVLLTYVDERALRAPATDGAAWMGAVADVGEPFLTGLDPAQAEEFFSARGLALLVDESTLQAARRLGVAGAEQIPSLYRIATLEVTGDLPDPRDRVLGRHDREASAGCGAERSP